MDRKDEAIRRENVQRKLIIDGSFKLRIPKGADQEAALAKVDKALKDALFNSGLPYDPSEIKFGTGPGRDGDGEPGAVEIVVRMGEDRKKLKRRHMAEEAVAAAVLGALRDLPTDEPPGKKALDAAKRMLATKDKNGRYRYRGRFSKGPDTVVPV